jgi:tight adherence protein B
VNPIKLALIIIPIFAIVAWLSDLWARRKRTKRKLVKLFASRVASPSPAGLPSLKRRSPELKIAALAILAILAASLMVNLNLYLTLAAAFIAVPLAWWFLRRRRLKKMRRDFSDYFAEAVDSLNRAVQAGVPVEKALASVGELYHGELGDRFRRLVNLLELGTPFREALADFTYQLDMPDVEFFCAVLALNRESGSKLSPLLTSLGRTLRERQSVDRKLRGLTAESRGAARILMVLPVVVIALQAFLNPSHLSFLLTDSIGRLLLGYAAVSMTAGFLIIQRMSRLTEV